MTSVSIVASEDRQFPMAPRGRGRLIALYSEVPQSGKSTAAEVLEKQFGCVPVKFAGPLKAMLRELLSWGGYDSSLVTSMLEGHLKEVTIPGAFGLKTPRQLMRSLGTEWGRDTVSSDIWLTLWKQKVGTLLGEGYNVVTDDMRFLNEYHATQDFPNSVAVKIVRPDAPRMTAAAHVSEGGLDHIPFSLAWVNTTTRENFVDLVRKNAGLIGLRHISDTETTKIIRKRTTKKKAT